MRKTFHKNIICELFCEYCGVPICEECASSTEHERHKKETFIKLYSLKEELILRDLQELEDIIYPSYKEVASNIPGQRADLDKHSQKLKISLNNKAETLHREIDSIIQKMHADIDAMNSEHLIAINKQETAIKQTIKEISQAILEVRRLMDTNDVHLVFKYQSKSHKLKILPTQLQVTLPRFEPTENDSKQISKQIGTLSKLESTWRPISTAFLDKPRILTKLYNRGRAFYGFETVNSKLTVNSICCLSDTEFWTCLYDDHLLRLYNLQGELIKSIKTKSWREPRSIAVTRNGDLVYTGYSYRSINLVHGTKIQTLIRLRGWRALNVCCTFAEELLVLMYTINEEVGQYEARVVRYFGSTLKQTIQWDGRGKPLYACKMGGDLTENRNLDICVADCDADAVVVVSADGQFRFKYFGYPYSTQGSFKPTGITTDSRANILITDCDNHHIHIVDQDGYFLRYIDNCGLHYPIDLSLDTSDNLFIAEKKLFIVKKIQYYK